MHSSVDTLNLSVASSRNTVVPSNRQWPGIFRQRTMGSMQLKSTCLAASQQIWPKRSNTAIGLATMPQHEKETAKSSRAPEPTKPNTSPRQHNAVHKLGTIPNYLSKRTTYTMESNLTIKRKQFVARKAKFCEQQKEIIEQYRTMLDMQLKWNRQTGKHTKLEELDVVAYRTDGSLLCLCAGPTNYGIIAGALSGAEKELNELDRWLSRTATEPPETEDAQIKKQSHEHPTYKSLSERLHIIFQKVKKLKEIIMTTKPVPISLDRSYTFRKDKNYQNFICEIEDQRQQIQNLEEKLKSVGELLSAEKYRCSIMNDEKSNIARQLTAQRDQSENCRQHQQYQLDCLESELKTMTNNFEYARMQSEAITIEDNEKGRQIVDLKASLTHAQNECLLLKNQLLNPAEICKQPDSDEVIKLKEENRYFRMKLNNDHQPNQTEESVAKNIDAKREKWARSKKLRDTIIVKLETLLMAEKSTVHEMQRQLTRVQQSEFDKNVEMDSLKGELIKVTFENEQMVNRFECKECNHDSHIGSMYAMIAKQAASMKRMEAELSIKTEELANNQLALERQTHTEQMLRCKQKRRREILRLQYEKICELKEENAMLYDRLAEDDDPKHSSPRQKLPMDNSVLNQQKSIKMVKNIYTKTSHEMAL